MKKYYINIANQQQGPYSLEDLKEKGITRETMVWFEGAENWQRANKIDELKDLFKTIPPPITTSNTATPPPLPNKPKSNKTAMYVILAGIVFIMIVGLTLLSSQKQQLEEQNAKIHKQQQDDYDRNLKAKVDKLTSLKVDLVVAQTNLELEQKRLKQIKEYQLLRTTYEREAQVDSQLVVIDNCKVKIKNIESDIKKWNNK